MPPPFPSSELPARLPVLVTSPLDGLISRQPSFSKGRPAIVEVPYPCSLCARSGPRELWDVSKRFKEPSPQPGLVISPLSGCAAETFIVLRVSLVET